MRTDIRWVGCLGKWRAIVLPAILLAAGCGDPHNCDGSAVSSPTALETSTPTAAPSPTDTEAPPPAVTPTPIDAALFRFIEPAERQLSLAGSIAVRLSLSPGAAVDTLDVELDGVPVTERLSSADGGVAGTLEGVGAGEHVLVAESSVGGVRLRARVGFEAVALEKPDECEVLNSAECMLPYPSSRFLVPAGTPTGLRLDFPAVGMPRQFGAPLSPDPYRVLDGFSPTVQILMHFPGGVDLTRSAASRLLPETRTYGSRSLEPDSPSVLIDAATGKRILHFLETDARAAGDPARQVLFLRPGTSLLPGHRYIVAMRSLVHPDGSAVEAEPPFAALRDGRPTTIATLHERQPRFENIFARLAQAGVPRQDLVLAFDFAVQSDTGLTGQMLSMRDQAFAWLNERIAAKSRIFTVDNVDEFDCAQPEAFVWRIVEGRYEVPLFLTSDPEVAPAVPGFLNVDEAGLLAPDGTTNPPFTIAIPCSVLDGDGSAKRPLLFGHGLFGTGRETLRGLVGAQGLSAIDLVIGATDFKGLSTPDTEPALNSFIVASVIGNLNAFAALPDRLRQGMLNTVMLGRMMKLALFNDAPEFRTPSDAGVFAGPEEEMYYFGASLGGIMGLFFSAVSPDISNANVDVPAINFSLLLQRATPFLQLEPALELSGITDPMQTALVLGVIHELWVRGESAGYATHITRDPLPGTNAKNILMTMAFLDQQVSNQATEIAARTLGLPNLQGSLLTNLPGIPDLPGPLPSALVVYDTGSFDLDNPAHAPFIPPLQNLQAEPNSCDPHGLRGFIPASIAQLVEFLQPGGEIENFCHDRCDAAEPFELPFGAGEPCDPLAP